MNITEKSFIKVKWECTPEDFTKEKQARIKAYFQNKYKCKNVTVQFTPINITGKQYTLDQSESIYDLANQRKLIEQFIKENELEVKMEEIIRLDERVNDKMKLQKDIGNTYRKLKVKRVWFDNFLSFGADNEFPFEELEGMVIVNSIPENFAGKTISNLDLLLYLFFNKTTRTSKDIQIFNIYRPEENQVKVKGTIELDNIEYLIERVLTRSGKTKITTNSQLRVVKIINGEEENISEDQRRSSEKIIKEAIGEYEDFMLTIMATGNNLEALIDQSPTERGSLVTRFIGLDVIKEKEAIAKEIKDEWEKTIKSNQYNAVDLFQEATTNKTLIVETQGIIEESDINSAKIVNDLKDLDLTKELLIGKKKEIDETLLGTDIEEEKEKFQTIITNGKAKKEEYQKSTLEFKAKTKPVYDEAGHDLVLKREKELEQEIHDQQMLITTKEKGIVNLKHAKVLSIQEKEKEIVTLKHNKEITIQEKNAEIVTIERTNERAVQLKEKEILSINMERASTIKAKEKEVTVLADTVANLKNGEFCQTCKRKFDDCDHTETIAAHEKTIADLNAEIDSLKTTEDPKVKPIQEAIDKMKKTEDPAIVEIRKAIDTLKTAEDPAIKVIQDAIETLKTTEDPAVKVIEDEIKEINEVAIPKIEKNKTDNKVVIDGFKAQSDALSLYEKEEVRLERLAVEVKALAQDFKEQDELIKRYETNLLAIDANKEVEKQIIEVNTRVDTKNQEKEVIIREKQVNEDKIKTLQKTIDDNEKLIKIINKEQEIIKVFEMYLLIFGKKGITSLILKSAIPVINSELDRLLNDTATFSMELDLNAKNDVEYWMVDRETELRKLVTTGSGYEKTAAALALRAVLTKISVLPKPDMLILDEVLGKVADVNLELMKMLLDKISEMFDKVFMITHNPLVKDWGDSIVTIEKIDNISHLKFAKNATKAQV
jgi:DNA repair exonuclease SbcCD ATPase subunit